MPSLNILLPFFSLSEAKMNKSDRMKLRRGPWGDLCFIAGCALLIWLLSLPPIFFVLLVAYIVYKIVSHARD